MWIEPNLCCTRAVAFNLCGVVDSFENLVKIVCTFFSHSVSGSLWTEGIHDRETKSEMFMGVDNRLDKESRNENTSCP